MARAASRTTLTLGDELIIPVGIVPATGVQEIKFDTGCRDGKPRKQLYVHPERTQTLYRAPEGVDLTEIPDSEIDALSVLDMVAVEQPEQVTEAVKGLRVGDTFRLVPDSEIDYCHAATKLDTVEVLEFIDFRRVPTERLTGHYWIEADPGFEKPLATIIEAMRRDGKAMLLKWNVKTRQRLGVIRVRRQNGGDALLLSNIVFAADWREPDDRVLAPGQTAVEERAVAAALRVIESLHGVGSSLDTAKDDLPDLLRKVVERAHEGIYDDPAKVLELASHYRDEDLGVRADRLVAWATKRWPEIAQKLDQVERVIAAGGDDVGEKLAELVG